MFRFILPKMIFRCERWKWNPEYRVYVSNLGHFKDEYKDNLPPKVNSGGYLLIKTRCGLKLAHRLVLQTWRPCPDYDNLTVDHLNHNKRDNSLKNLEWITFEENQARAKADYQIIGLEKYIPIAEKAIQEIKALRNGNVIVENVAKKIKKAAETDTLYCGRKWEKL